ncbi:GNAT family N-acetyltransferase [Antrihabitans cavernicola]|uniref:GNAT family N-acetyltransferase n=1 Tax=Antrihabitans cavernicola TaxID=2495913 RepID=A0A5A7SH65_9NOCA|nr:GNAT family N-acetyltransferase [Spelaeibacter cavernicola]KAA0024739.1 GNAT family N-acetyltransferase [Spelaeibacter cavernicola]
MDSDDVRIEAFEGDHRSLEWSFREAEDSQSKLDSYIDDGRVWVAVTAENEVIGHLHVIASPDGTSWEVVNTAVVERRRGSGVGRRLLDTAVDEARRAGAHRIELATATADIGNLRFYQRCGFRMRSIVRDAFGPHTGYNEPIDVDGIPLRDQVWFDLDLQSSTL